MNAAQYFELVDAIAGTDGSPQLKLVADRIAATPMHPLERRVLDRALRARTEALAIQRQLLAPELLGASLTEASQIVARG
jgi:hypothetical protein